MTACVGSDGLENLVWRQSVGRRPRAAHQFERVPLGVLCEAGEKVNLDVAVLSLYVALRRLVQVAENTQRAGG